MSEIRTLEQYCVDRLETLENDKILQEAELKRQQEISKNYWEDLRRVAELLIEYTTGEEGNRLKGIRLSAFEAFEEKDYKFLKRIKDVYGSQN